MKTIKEIWVVCRDVAFWTLLTTVYKSGIWDYSWVCAVCSFFRIIKIADHCREAQMKKEANIQRMAEKQKEAKLAVRAILSNIFHLFTVSSYCWLLFIVFFIVLFFVVTLECSVHSHIFTVEEFSLELNVTDRLLFNDVLVFMPAWYMLQPFYLTVYLWQL